MRGPWRGSIVEKDTGVLGLGKGRRVCIWERGMCIEVAMGYGEDKLVQMFKKHHSSLSLFIYL